jgi:hypothetical protein
MTTAAAAPTFTPESIECETMNFHGYGGRSVIMSGEVTLQGWFNFPNKEPIIATVRLTAEEVAALRTLAETIGKRISGDLGAYADPH